MNGLVGGAVGYTDTKFAVRGLTKAAALQLAPMGIRVNSVHPGVIETPMVTQGDAVDTIREFAKHIPLKRLAQSEEVSNIVLFLASDESSYSTGSEFYHRWWINSNVIEICNLPVTEGASNWMPLKLYLCDSVQRCRGHE